MQLYKIIVFIALFALPGISQAQEKSKVMESRARDMVRIIGLDDREAWKNFIRDNFTKEMINKGMRAKTTAADDETTATKSTSTESGNIEGKADMFERLHGDFGAGKVTAFNIEGDVAKMKVLGKQFEGTFILKFKKDSPWLIDGIGIEVDN